MEGRPLLTATAEVFTTKLKEHPQALAVVLRCLDAPPPQTEETQPTQHNVFFVIDESTSIEDQMPLIQASVGYGFSVIKNNKGLRGSLTGFTETVVHHFPANDRVALSHVDDANYAQLQSCILGLKADGWTNISDPLEQVIDFANEGDNKQTASSIILLSDGVANRGARTTAVEFKRLLETKATSTTQVYSIGLGNSYDLRLMKTLGDFTHVTERDVPTVFGAIMGKIVTQYATGSRIEPRERDGKTPCVLLAGSPEMGTLYAQREYKILLPFSDKVQPTTLHLTCFSMADKKQISCIVPLPQPDKDQKTEIPFEWLKFYYLYNVSGMIEEVAMEKRKLEDVKEQLEQYSNEDAVPDEVKQRIRQLFASKSSANGDMRQVTSAATDARTQSSNVNAEQMTVAVRTHSNKAEGFSSCGGQWDMQTRSSRSSQPGAVPGRKSSSQEVVTVLEQQPGEGAQPAVLPFSCLPRLGENNGK